MKDLADRVRGISPSLTLAITAKGNKMKADGIDVVSFGAGEPDFDTPVFIRDKAKEALDLGLTRYTPSSGTLDLRKAICAKLKKDNNLEYAPNEIVVSNGAKHSLYNSLLAIINEGDEVIVPAPYWLTYPELIKLCNGVPVYVDAKIENDFKITPEQLKNAITKKTKAMIFNSPSNPSGVVYTRDEIIALGKVIEEADIFVISDEIYEYLTYEDEFFSMAQVSPKLKENTILVNGMSKSYAMTGWRVGFTASNRALSVAMDNIQSQTTSNPNSIAQYASITALSDYHNTEFLTEMKEVFDRRRKLIMKKLKAIDKLSFIEPKGAFYIMIGIEKLVGKQLDGVVIRSAADFADLLIDKVNVVSVPCESFGAPLYIRLSYAVADEVILKGLERIEKLLRLIN